MPICYIFASGEYGNQWPDIQSGDLSIAADGGYAQMQAHGVDPDLVVGDFDSLGYVPPHPHIVRHPAEKDDTDTALALSGGWRRGYRTSHIYDENLFSGIFIVDVGGAVAVIQQTDPAVVIGYQAIRKCLPHH